MTKRGLIISPPFESVGNYLRVISSTIDSLTLRKYLLYWDLLDLPENNIIKIGGETPEIEQLAKAGVLMRSKVNLVGEWGVGYAIPAMQVATFVTNNKRVGETWSIAQISDNLLLPGQETFMLNAIEVELYNALPVPIPSVPIDSILEFKERRREELLNFRGSMDDFYLDISNSKEILRAKERAIGRIQESYHDLNRVMHESKIRRVLSTLKVELNVSDIAKELWAAYAAGTITFALGQPPATSVLVGLAAAAIKVSIKVIPKINQIPLQLMDYAYLSSIEKDLVAKKKRRRRKKK